MIWRGAWLVVVLFSAGVNCRPGTTSSLSVATRIREIATVPSPAPTVTATSTTPTPHSTLPSVQVSATISATPTTTTSESTDLPHYRLEANLDYYGHTLDAQQWITVTNDSSQSWTELVFNVSAAYWPGRFELFEATLIQADRSEAASVRWDGTMLHVPLLAELAPGAKTAVNFVFRLHLPQLDPLGWGPDGNAGWGAGVTQVGDWYPALIPYQEESGGWHTWDYHPVGDPVRSRLADYDLLLRSQPAVIIAASGFREQKGGQFRFHLEAARAIAFLASPDYILLEHHGGPVPIAVYVLADHESRAATVLETAIQAVDLFSSRYGPYPYPELVIAENGFLTAMEYSALISLSNYAFATYEASPDSLLVAITAHEVAHQWFYGAVGSDQVEAPWMDESLAMLSEWIFYETYYPSLVEWWWQYRVERWDPAGFVDVTIYEFPDSRSFVHNMYGRGAQFMRDLRLLMGEEAFAHFLQYYTLQHYRGWATADDFFAATRRFAQAEALREVVERYFRAIPPSLAGAARQRKERPG